jgi:Organic solute transporter Ostalpha
VCAVVNLAALYVSEKAEVDIFCEGSSSLKCVYPYTTYFLLAWQTIAVYAIMIFYHELEHELKELEALQKLIIVKMVVLVTFWVSIIIYGLTYSGVIAATLTYSASEIGIAVQNFVVCLLLAIGALAHHRYFSQGEFVGERGGQKPYFSSGPIPVHHALMVFVPLDIFFRDFGVLVNAVSCAQGEELREEDIEAMRAFLASRPAAMRGEGGVHGAAVAAERGGAAKVAAESEAERA